MKSKKPLISIIVPVYNGAKYIDTCLQSIIKQTYNNTEIILINDGSTDNSEEILNKWQKKDKRVKVIHQQNGGVSNARNSGLNIAKGEYITFIDIDDYIYEDYINYLYTILEKNNADISVIPQPQKFTSSTPIIQKEQDDKIIIMSGIEAACNMLYYNFAIGPWNKLISHSLITKNHLKFHEHLHFGEGFNFSIDCFQRANKVAVGHKKYYFYRTDNPNSAMTKFKKRVVIGSLEAQKEIQKNILNPTKETMRACKYANWHTICDCYNMIIGCKVIYQNKELYLDLKKKCRKDALCVLNAPISKKDKIKGIFYFINPYFTAKLINRCRIRKFTPESIK